MDESTWPGDLRVVQGDWTASGLFPFEEVEARLHAARRFVRLIDDTVGRELETLREDVAEGKAKLGIDRLQELRDEFPLLAWSTTLGFCFSTLEAFLAECARNAAEVIDVQPPVRVQNPQVEGWLGALRRLGVHVRVPPPAATNLASLRRVRNELMHSLRIDARKVDARLRPLLRPDLRDQLIPTVGLVWLAIETAETHVLAVDRAFIDFGERRALEPLKRYGRYLGRPVD